MSFRYGTFRPFDRLRPESSIKKCHFLKVALFGHFFSVKNGCSRGRNNSTHQEITRPSLRNRPKKIHFNFDLNASYRFPQAVFRNEYYCQYIHIANSYESP